MAFIDDNRQEFGVEPICEMLEVAPSTYYAARKRVPSARGLRDQVMIPILVVLWTVNRPWRNVADVELATLGWVSWFNHTRLHGKLGDTPPVEYEEAH